MRIKDRIPVLVRALTATLMLFSCFFMCDFYKCLSGFVANGFREPLVMLPMILSFLLPVICFLFFFYDFYVRKIKRTAKIVYSSFVIAYAAAMLALIFSNISLYARNNALGVYESLPSIVLRFPFDMIIVLFVLIFVQVFNIFSVFKPKNRVATALFSLRQEGTIKLSLAEYIPLSTLAIVAFIFTGSGITACFSAFANVYYDARFFFLILWVSFIPLGNLLTLALKPEKMKISKRGKILTLEAAIAINAGFTLLFVILELTHRNFIVHVGKPMFLIAFSVSMPIEPALINLISLIGSAFFAWRMIRLIRDK